MLTGIAITLTAALSMTVLAALFRYAGIKNHPRLMLFGLGSLVAWLLSLTGIQWSKLSGTLRLTDLLLVMIIGGIAKAIGQLLRIRAFGMGHGAVTYVACQSAMVISFLFAVFVWDEPLTAVRAAGIVLILAMFVLISKLEKPAHASPMDSRRWLIITILSLSLIGVCQILYMTPSHWDGWTDPGGLRIPLVTLAGSFGALGMAYYKKQTFNRTVVFTAIGIGLCMFINLRLILLALDLLTPLKASGLVHPMATGAAVVFFTLYSRFILRELFRLRHWLGLSIGVVGLTLMGL